MNTKRHNRHFLKAKKTRANSKLLSNSRSKEFPLISHGVFFLCKCDWNECFLQGRSKAQPIFEKGLKQNQFVWKVWSASNLWRRSKTTAIYKKGFTLNFEQFVSFKFHRCYNLGNELLASWFVVSVMSFNFVNKELQ